MHVNCEPRLVWENVVMTGSNCVHRPSDAIDDVTLGSDSDHVTLPLTSNVDIVLGNDLPSKNCHAVFP